MKVNKLGYLYVAVAASFFAVIAIIGKTVINTGMNIYDLVILQYIATVLIMLVYFLIKDPKIMIIRREQWKPMLIQGIIGSTGTTYFYYLALERLNAGIASMLLFTHPALVFLYYIISKAKKLSPVTLGALAFAVTGSAMVINIFQLDILKTSAAGLLFGVLASLSYAFFNVNYDKNLKEFDPLAVTFYTSGVILVIALIINPGFFRFDFVMNGKVLFYVLELAVISGILPIIFLYKGIGMIGAERASIVATAELPITLIFAYFILNEGMSWIQIAGVVLIVASIIILQNEEQIAAFRKNKRKTY